MVRDETVRLMQITPDAVQGFMIRPVANFVGPKTAHVSMMKSRGKSRVRLQFAHPGPAGRIVLRSNSSQTAVSRGNVNVIPQ